MTAVTILRESERAEKKNGVIQAQRWNRMINVGKGCYAECGGSSNSAP